LWRSASKSEQDSELYKLQKRPPVGKHGSGESLPGENHAEIFALGQSNMGTPRNAGFPWENQFEMEVDMRKSWIKGEIFHV